MKINTNPKIAKEIASAMAATQEFRSKALEAYDFYSGDQWSSDDKNILESQGRPTVTFNRISPLIDAVTGFQLSNRQQVKFNPRGLEDCGVAELINRLVEYTRDKCDADEEESHAFLDCLVTGLGFTETRISYENDLDGEIITERVSPFEMIWDQKANNSKNIEKAKWVARFRRMSKDEVLEKWDKSVLSQLATDISLTTYQSDIHDYDADRDFDLYNGVMNEVNKDEYVIYQYQFYKMEDIYRVGDPLTGKILQLSSSQFNKIKSTLDERGTSYVKQKIKNYYQKWVSGNYEWGETPIKGFTFKAITGKYDLRHKLFFGIVRNLLDPQQWANKFISQTLHLINKNAKGGIVMEIDAVDDIDGFAESWAMADQVSVVNSGGLAKLKDKISPNIPSAIQNMLVFASDSIGQVSGINEELIGQKSAESSAVLEHERKHAALATIGWIFSAMKKYRKVQGRLIASMIIDFLPNPTIERIVGPELAQFIPALRVADVLKYDLVVDSSPDSPNVKAQVFSIFRDILPTMINAAIPIPPDIVNYLPLPESFTQKWIQLIEQKSQPQPDPAAEALTENLKAQSQERISRAQLNQAQAQVVQQKAEIDQFKAQIEAFKAAIQAQTEMGKLDVTKAKGIMDAIESLNSGVPTVQITT